MIGRPGPGLTVAVVVVVANPELAVESVASVPVEINDQSVESDAVRSIPLKFDCGWLDGAKRVVGQFGEEGDEGEDGMPRPNSLDFRAGRTVLSSSPSPSTPFGTSTALLLRVRRGVCCVESSPSLDPMPPSVEDDSLSPFGKWREERNPNFGLVGVLLGLTTPPLNREEACRPGPLPPLTEGVSLPELESTLRLGGAGTGGGDAADADSAAKPAHEPDVDRWKTLRTLGRFIPCLGEEIDRRGDGSSSRGRAEKDDRLVE